MKSVKLELCDIMEPVNESLVREHYRSLTQELISRQLTVATMESATAGQIGSLITDTEGSSSIYPGGLITYSNESKIRFGVPAEIIGKYSVYSKETAAAMAAACKDIFGADIGIGVTGTLGNIDPANPEASVPGRVYYAINLSGEVRAYYSELPPQPSRLLYKLSVAEFVYEALKEVL